MGIRDVMSVRSIRGIRGVRGVRVRGVNVILDNTRCENFVNFQRKITYTPTNIQVSIMEYIQVSIQVLQA